MMIQQELWGPFLPEGKETFTRDEVLELMELAHREAGSTAEKVVGLIGLIAEEAEDQQKHFTILYKAMKGIRGWTRSPHSMKNEAIRAEIDLALGQVPPPTLKEQ